MADKTTDFEEPDGEPLPRQSSRVETCAEVALRRPGQGKYRVRIFDLSPEGARIEFVERPRVGELSWVKFDGLAAIEAKVRWVEGHVAGIRFESPLHSAVFDQLLARCQSSG